MRDHAEPLRRRDVEDVDAVAGDREQVRTIGLHAIALIDARDLSRRLGIISRRRTARGGGGRRGNAAVEHHDRPTPPRPHRPAEHVAPAGHRRLNRPRLQPGDVSDRCQGVRALVADKLLALVESHDIDARGAVERIDCQATVECVSARAGADGVNAGTAEEHVVAAAAHDRVDAAVAADLVVASTAVESIAARAAENHVGTIAPRDHVVAESSFEPRGDALVAGHVHRDRVVAKAGNDVDRLHPSRRADIDHSTVHGRPQLAGIHWIRLDDDRVVGQRRARVTHDRPRTRREAHRQRVPGLEPLDNPRCLPGSGPPPIHPLPPLHDTASGVIARHRLHPLDGTGRAEPGQ